MVSSILCKAVQKSQVLYYYLASDLEQSLEICSGYKGSYVKVRNGITQHVAIKSLQEVF